MVAAWPACTPWYITNLIIPSHPRRGKSKNWITFGTSEPSSKLLKPFLINFLGFRVAQTGKRRRLRLRRQRQQLQLQRMQQLCTLNMADLRPIISCPLSHSLSLMSMLKAATPQLIASLSLSLSQGTQVWHFVCRHEAQSLSLSLSLSLLIFPFLVGLLFYSRSKTSLSVECKPPTSRDSPNHEVTCLRLGLFTDRARTGSTDQPTDRVLQWSHKLVVDLDQFPTHTSEQKYLALIWPTSFSNSIVNKCCLAFPSYVLDDSHQTR